MFEKNKPAFEAHISARQVAERTKTEDEAQGGGKEDFHGSADHGRQGASKDRKQLLIRRVHGDRNVEVIHPHRSMVQGHPRAPIYKGLLFRMRNRRRQGPLFSNEVRVVQ